ncbi:MAG TPA: integrase arm-type DNA-binding domain-containing protein [Bradyrhizobium sp.]|jgi:integrase|uniref:tyrosine-type recombinase/integrase n=1 Tax=Bradyrhizobium sp. TaxID=376 RepID=UPI002C863B93|nr:integrase arm-type DNA-binding domain-containing protein [Bradyrhizobium sp.]HXB77797.1 integrase arm-type DNA-binding domain-containing protein [Bradyrhizobium sp.]
MRKRLTDRTVKALKPASADAAPVDIMDSLTPAFGVRVMGAPERPIRTFILRTRFPGSKNPTRARLGSYDETDKLSLEDARDKARNWLAAIRRGRDPRIEEERKREAEIRKLVTTFGAVAEDFIKEKLPGERRGAHVEREIKNEFRGWWNRPISEISDEDVIRVIRAKAKTAPSSARNILGHAKRLFQWAMDQRTYGLKQSPAASIKPDSIVGKKISRNHVLEDDELFAFWRSLSRMPYPSAPVYRLLLLTGLRLNEVAEAAWSEFNPTVVRAIRQRGEAPIDWTQFDPQQLTWTIPAARMKGQNGTARAHTVPLTVDMLRIIETVPMFAGGDFLFSHSAGRTAAIMSSENKDALDARMLRTLRALARTRGDDPAAVALEWINHDLRRNVRSGLSRLKIAEEVREAVLAHARPGIKGVYDQHDYLDEKRDALLLWGARLRSIVEPSPVASNVVAMRPAS